MTKGWDIARKIVRQALEHEDAIETKISVATLLIGIETEFNAAEQVHASDVDPTAGLNPDFNWGGDP